MRVVDDDFVILNQCQAIVTVLELSPPVLTSSPHQSEHVQVSANFTCIDLSLRWGFSSTRLEITTHRVRDH
ncbi:hypothetical protein TNCV_194031 [Trichonephila clavipes]|nr:hypothetical protein TNCV_194031 [Trichonephila clavipes]